jgi:hypothetical protein
MSQLSPLSAFRRYTWLNHDVTARTCKNTSIRERLSSGVQGQRSGVLESRLAFDTAVRCTGAKPVPSRATTAWCVFAPADVSDGPASEKGAKKARNTAIMSCRLMRGIANAIPQHACAKVACFSFTIRRNSLRSRSDMMGPERAARVARCATTCGTAIASSMYFRETDFDLRTRRARLLRDRASSKQACPSATDICKATRMQKDSPHPRSPMPPQRHGRRPWLARWPVVVDDVSIGKHQPSQEVAARV